MFYKLDAIALQYDSFFFSNRLKDVLFFTYLKQLDDNEIVLFTDAIDAVFVSDEEEILNKFSKFNSHLVFSAEVNCWPDNSLEKGYPGYENSTYFKYLNSGAFIGRAGYLKKLYQKYPIFETGDNPRFAWSNQYYWNIIFKKEWPNIQLDYGGEIFYNTSIPSENNDTLLKSLQEPKMIEIMFTEEKKRLDAEIIFSNGRLKSNITNSLPCHIHFPGTISKLLMERGYFDSLKKQA